MKICIDAGHNYSLYDTGAVGNGLREQDITFSIAEKLKDLLKSAGVEVVMTRPDIKTNVGKNADDSIIQRYKIANNNKCDYFISIHCNSYENPSANGTETLIVGKGGEAEKLAEKVNSEIVKTLNTSDRGIKVRGDLGVLKYTNMPAILVECAFISNTKDAQMLRDKQTEFATAIFNGFCNYAGIKKSNMVETGNDIDYVLKVKYGISFESLENEKAFIRELDELRSKDSKAYWVFYKLANGIKETSMSAKATYTYKTVGTTHIIECDPMTVKNVMTNCPTNKTSLKNFVNGTYIMKQANGIYAPLGMCVNEDKVFNNYMTHQKPVATLIVYKDGRVEMKYVSDITKIKDVRFAISGYGVYPEITASEEGFTGVYADVLRSADRPIIGYRKADNKIVIAVRGATSAERAKLTAENLKLDFAISLDAGGTTTLIVDGKFKFKGDGRMNYGGITWE